MMCEECGVRPAKFHLTTIAGDQKQERRLCPVCMAKYQKQLPGIDFTNLAGLLSSFLEGVGKSSEQVDPETEALSCPGCGMTYTTFRKGGKLGCAECYKAFKKPIEALLLRVHGNTQHAGKIPGGLKSDVSIRLNIDRLKQQLVRAIAEEAYEDAAQLRDQIRALNAQLEAEASVKEGGAQDE